MRFSRRFMYMFICIYSYTYIFVFIYIERCFTFIIICIYLSSPAPAAFFGSWFLFWFPVPKIFIQDAEKPGACCGSGLSSEIYITLKGNESSDL